MGGFTDYYRTLNDVWGSADGGRSTVAWAERFLPSRRKAKVLALLQAGQDGLGR